MSKKPEDIVKFEFNMVDIAQILSIFWKLVSRSNNPVPEIILDRVREVTNRPAGLNIHNRGQLLAFEDLDPKVHLLTTATSAVLFSPIGTIKIKVLLTEEVSWHLELDRSVLKEQDVAALIDEHCAAEFIQGIQLVYYKKYTTRDLINILNAF